MKNKEPKKISPTNNLILIIFLVTLGLSCKKDIDLGKTNFSEIIEAKEWFRNQHIAHYMPDWDKAKTTKLYNQNFVILPSNFIFSGEEGRVQSYLIINTSAKMMQAKIIELVDLKQQVNKERDIFDILNNYFLYGDKANFSQNLSLKTLIFDINHNFLEGIYTANGISNNLINLNKLTELNGDNLWKDIGNSDYSSRGVNKVMGGVNKSKEKGCIDWYMVYYNNGKVIDEEYLYTTCDTGSDGDGSSGSGIKNSTKEIKNDIKDPCLKATVDEALSTNKNVKGFLANLINKYSQTNNGILINIQDGKINGTATTGPSIITGGRFETNITLNSNYFRGTTKEFVVNQLIHEVVHAYLIQTNSDYRALPEKEKHNFLFKNFIKDIAGYLIDKYTMPRNDAWALAWSGVYDTYSLEPDDTTFNTDPGENLTKLDIGLLSGSYGYVGANSKGTANCNN